MTTRSRTFLFCFAAAFCLVAAGTGGAYHTRFVADNCNYAAPTPTPYITRDGSAATVAVPSLTGDGYATISYAQPLGESLYLTCVDSPRGEGGPRAERGPAYLVEMRVSLAPVPAR